MTQKEFIKELDEKGYSYEIEGDKVIATDDGNVNLESLTSLPLGVEFGNGGYVNLESLTSLPPGVEFKNRGNVWLGSLTSLPPGVEFKNAGSVNLWSLVGGDGPFHKWKGNIDGIDSKSLLNVMIKQGVFER